MVNEDPRPGSEPPDDGREPQRDYDTEPIPRVTDGGGLAFGAPDDGAGAAFGGEPSGYRGVQLSDEEPGGIVAEAVGGQLGYDVEPLFVRDPSDLVRRYMFPTEKFRGEWRRHWIQLASLLGWGALATFLLGIGAGYLSRIGLSGGVAVAGAVWLLIMLWVFWGIVSWNYVRFVLTNKRVMLIQGIFARDVAMMPLARVTDMKYIQSPLGRLLNYGTFELESAGQEQALRIVKNMPNPTDLYLQVVEEMYEPEASEARRKPAPATDDGS